MGKIFRTMPYYFVASYFSVIHNDKPRARKIILQADCPALKTSGSRYDFECRTRLICVIDAAISPHHIQQILFTYLFYPCLSLLCRVILLYFLHLKFVNQRKRFVQIKFRNIRHRKNLAIIDIHDNYGHPRRLFCLICLPCQLCRIFLYVDIQAYVQILSCHRLFSALPHAVKLDSLGICQCQYLPFLSCQVLLICHFQSDYALIVSTSKP